MAGSSSSRADAIFFIVLSSLACSAAESSLSAASFGVTVMGRIALLAARFEFLFDDWLWLIDPSGKH